MMNEQKNSIVLYRDKSVTFHYPPDIHSISMTVGSANEEPALYLASVTVHGHDQKVVELPFTRADRGFHLDLPLGQTITSVCLTSRSDVITISAWTCTVDSFDLQ